MLNGSFCPIYHELWLQALFQNAHHVRWTMNGKIEPLTPRLPQNGSQAGNPKVCLRLVQPKQEPLHYLQWVNAKGDQK